MRGFQHGHEHDRLLVCVLGLPTDEGSACRHDRGSDRRSIMNAIVYTRVSTKEQAEEGYSIAAQAEACRRLIAERGWTVVDEFVDRGESARTADRPQFQQMLEHIREDGSIQV